MLLQNQVNVNAQGGTHGNALRAASHQNRLEVLEILLNYKADVNLFALGSMTAIQAAMAIDGPRRRYPTTT